MMRRIMPATAMLIVLAGCDGDSADCRWMPEAARGVSPILRAALCLLRDLATKKQAHSALAWLKSARSTGV